MDTPTRIEMSDLEGNQKMENRPAGASPNAQPPRAGLYLCV